MTEHTRPYLGSDKPEYGSIEYYKEYFSDVICDAGSGESPEEQIAESMKILEGFKQAVLSWLEYHRTSAMTYEDLFNQFMNYDFVDDRIEQAELEAEELNLPDIPDIPSLIKPGLTK